MTRRSVTTAAMTVRQLSARLRSVGYRVRLGPRTSSPFWCLRPGVPPPRGPIRPALRPPGRGRSSAGLGAVPLERLPSDTGSCRSEPPWSRSCDPSRIGGPRWLKRGRRPAVVGRPRLQRGGVSSRVPSPSNFRAELDRGSGGDRLRGRRQPGWQFDNPRYPFHPRNSCAYLLRATSGIRWRSPRADHAAGEAVVVIDSDLQDPPGGRRGAGRTVASGADVVHAVPPSGRARPGSSDGRLVSSTGSPPLDGPGD